MFAIERCEVSVVATHRTRGSGRFVMSELASGGLRPDVRSTRAKELLFCVSSEVIFPAASYGSPVTSEGDATDASETVEKLASVYDSLQRFKRTV